MFSLDPLKPVCRHSPMLVKHQRDRGLAVAALSQISFTYSDVPMPFLPTNSHSREAFTETI